MFRRIHGHYNSRITPNGYRQIAALERRFADVPIDAVYASDLFRTCETAKAIYLPKGLPLQKDARFREVYLGRWEDVPFGHLEQFEPEQMHNFSHAPKDWHIAGAESFWQYSDRFITALADVAQRHDGQTIAVFTHGCVSSESLRRLFGQQIDEAGYCDNTAVSLIRYDGGQFTGEFFYDNTHLDDDISTLARQRWWRGKGRFNLWYRPAASGDDGIFPQPLGRENEILVAMLGDTPVGYIALTVLQGTPVLTDLYLCPDYRHRRMGDQLLGHVICTLRHRCESQVIFTLSQPQTEAQSFFGRYNAKEVGRTENGISYVLSCAMPALP